MKIEKINENKIRITLNITDLEKNNIDLHSFMSNSEESQEMFLRMLDEAEKEVGFVTDDHRIMIEALATSDGSFVLTVTKLSNSENKEANSKKRKINIKRKKQNENPLKLIYCFENFDEYCNFCTFLNNSVFRYLDSLAENTSLYLHNNNYYLVIKNLNINVNLFKSFLASTTEFAKYVNSPELFENKLLEYGKLIMNEKAIDTGIKYFVT